MVANANEVRSIFLTAFSLGHEGRDMYFHSKMQPYWSNA